MFQNYEKEVKARCAGAINKDLHQLFGDLRDSSPDSARPKTPAKAPKPAVAMKKVTFGTKPLKRTKRAGIRKMKRTTLPKSLRVSIYHKNMKFLFIFF